MPDPSRMCVLLAAAAGLGALVACGGTSSSEAADSGTSSTHTADSDTADSDTAASTPAAAPQEDVFVQERNPEVDVLWVVDDTAGAASLRSDLTQRFPVFMDYFLGTGIDYHIGIVTTDMVDSDESGRLQGASGAVWIDAYTADPVGVFAAIVDAMGGTAPTAGRDAAHTALEILDATDNAGFARATAALVVVTVSPAADASTTITLDDWIAWLEAERGDPELTSHVTIGVPAGSDYEAVTAAVDGLGCADAAMDCLEAVGLHAAGYTAEYPLSQVPLPETIEVEVIEDGITLALGPDDWAWDAPSNILQLLEYIPNHRAEVHVRYIVAP